MPATPAWPPQSTPRLFVETALSQGVQLRVEGPQAHYLIAVMRMKPSDPVKLFDGESGEWLGIAIAVNKRDLMLDVTELLREREAVPELAETVKLPALLRAWPAGRTLFFADETGGDPALEAMRSHRGAAAILIGPEGGFDSEEREAIRAVPGAVGISLGPRILRADTAAAAAVSLWMAAAGDW